MDTESGHGADCWLVHLVHCYFGVFDGRLWADMRLRTEAGVVVEMGHVQREVGQPTLHPDARNQSSHEPRKRHRSQVQPYELCLEVRGGRGGCPWVKVEAEAVSAGGERGVCQVRRANVGMVKKDVGTGVEEVEMVPRSRFW